jgi:hypothetical protein
MDDFLQPAYYVACRDLDAAGVETLANALRITPITAAIITDPYDCELARKFSDEIYAMPDFEAAKVLAIAWFLKFGQPSLIVGDVSSEIFYAAT